MNAIGLVLNSTIHGPIVSGETSSNPINEGPSENRRTPQNTAGLPQDITRPTYYFAVIIFL